MVTIEEMEAMLDELAMELPQAFYKDLNGGIMILPDIKVHDKAVGDDFYILGEYHVDGRLGRYIVLYYGSFIRVHGHLSNEQMKEKLMGTLKHEFRHHLESLAGEKDLEVIDAMNVAEYLDRKKKGDPSE